jgi:REP element-mobilizing transposase RayT
MPYRHNVFAPDQIYHVYNRGVNGMDIFAQPENYRYLLRKVKRLLAELPIALLAYCLMPNHYHFVLRQESEVPISTFMQRLFQSYTQAFNKQQGRRGPLCEGRFRHVHVDRDEYLVYLCRYVHLNPVEAGLVAQPSDWPYSNYLEWIEARAGTLVDRAFVRQYFSTPADYVAFVEDAIPPEKERGLRPYLLD